MKKILSLVILSIVLFCGFSISLSAQAGSVLTLDKGSFRLEQTNALGGVNIDPIGKDLSNRACFRLKLHLDRMTPEDIRQVEVKVLGGNVVLMKREVASGGNGLILEMTARPETRFYIKHPSLGESNTVTISPEADKVYLMDGWADQKLTIVVSCAKAGADVWLDGVYRGKTGADMTLSVKDVMAGPHTVKIQSGEDTAEQQIEVTSDKVYFNIELKSAAHLQQFVVFNVTPADTLVIFDGTPIRVNSGTASKRVKFGTYSYTVSAKDFHTYSGSVTVNDMKNKSIVKVDLKPAHGWISITGTSADGSYVYLADELIGQAPLKTDRLASGTYSIRLIKDLYKSYETTVTVTDGNVTTISPVLQADFARVTLSVDNGAEIWVNGEHKGSGSWTGDLATGSYLVECRKANHRSTSDNINVSADMPSRRITLKAPSPINGSLSISSAPDFAEVYLDGTHIGQTPLYLPETLIGSHTLKLSKPGCADWTGNVNVAEGQIAEINATMQSLSVQESNAHLSVADILTDKNYVCKLGTGETLQQADNEAYKLIVAHFVEIYKNRGSQTYDLMHKLCTEITGKLVISDEVGSCKIIRYINNNDFIHRLNNLIDNVDSPLKLGNFKEDTQDFASSRETITVNGVSFDLIKVECGTFTMGATSEQGNDAQSDEKTHKVTLSDYYIGETEVTQALWQAVMGSNPSRFKGSSNPVEYVSWYDCQEFIRKLNSLTGRTFRLPTEAEWEFAARGGNKSKGYKYAGSNSIDDVAWYDSNSGSMTHAVKTKSPNELGIYDMSGNVWEWCQDWYGSYSSNAQTNPAGPSNGSYRVSRGGSWYRSARYCRVSPRSFNSPDIGGYGKGLRMVLVP